MRCRCRIVGSLLGLLLLSGCQARQMVDHYLSFDAVVSDLYEKHVLYNLARREAGRTMVQMSYTSFSANLNQSLGTSGKVAFFTNPQTTGNSASSVSLNAFQQSFEPTVNSSVATGLNINSAPADNQDFIRTLYDEQVGKPEESRIFRRTTSKLVAMRSYCWIHTTWGEMYYVPCEKHAEFADFVHKVSFKVTPPAPPSTLPAATQPTTMR